jgi:FAD/FMN-containing dehydrogenase
MAAESSTAGLTSKLARFSSQHDGITLLTTTFESESFDTLRPIFVNPHTKPLAIIRPSTIEAVSATVSFLATNQIPFTVRVGGHDMHGRSVEDGGVVLDLRLLNHVVINKSGSEAKGGKIATARIGGGVLIGDLLSALEPHGLATPVGTVAGVGYLGWAMHGGYGPYSSGFGLGVDQIVAAKVVDATGSIVDADGELLKGIKGAGGAFGVVVEAVVRVYELDSVCPAFENHQPTTRSGRQVIYGAK